MTGIRKVFPGVVALDDVDLQVRRGEVHVVLGENGAGKSTLMKVLSGAYRKDAGRIVIDGRETEISGPRHAQTLGIAIIYQELALVPRLTAAENIVLGREPRRLAGIVDRTAMRATAAQALGQLGASVDVNVPVGTLSIAQQQLVEVAKALSLDARIIVMDEPTSALTARETRALFDTIGRLKARGVSIIYISHRLDEIFEVGDRVTVLRDGRNAGTFDVRGASRGELVRLMADRPVDERVTRTSATRGTEMLRVEGLSRRGAFQDVSFVVHAGEIVGLAGLLGSGRTSIARAIFGLEPPDAGRVLVRGVARRLTSPRDAIRAGVGFVTEDRKREGLVLGLSVRENLVMPRLRAVSAWGVIRRGEELAIADRYAQALRVKSASLEQPVRELSGGNQQKVVLGKWLACNVDVLILDEPTRGIDVGAKQEFYGLIDRLAEAGVGILLISSELPEIVGLCDRVLVMRAGRVAGEFAREGLTPHQVLTCAVGA